MRNVNYSFLPPGILPLPVDLVFKQTPLIDDEFARVCSMVYAPNPVTGLPSSDLQILFSDSVPTEIADWVRKNLQSPQSAVPSSIVQGHEVDDDTIISLTRNVGEDDRSYINRCDGLIRDYLKQDVKHSEES